MFWKNKENVKIKLVELSDKIVSLERTIEALNTELANRRVINRKTNYYSYFPISYDDTQAISIPELSNEIELIKNFLKIEKASISETKMVKAKARA